MNKPIMSEIERLDTNAPLGSELNPKRDTRGRRGYWEPGAYGMHCQICRDWFWGAASALHCAECAYGDLGPSKNRAKPGLQEGEGFARKDPGTGDPETTLRKTRIALVSDMDMALQKLNDLCSKLAAAGIKVTISSVVDKSDPLMSRVLVELRYVLNDAEYARFLTSPTPEGGEYLHHGGSAKPDF